MKGMKFSQKLGTIGGETLACNWDKAEYMISSLSYILGV